MIIIDGSYGEGGGQILRTALSLGALTRTAVRVEHVRIRRTKPGLSPQHLLALRAIAQVCQAEIEGARLGATDIEFRPHGPPQGGEYVFDMDEAAEGGSAGSVMLLFQSLLLPLAFADEASRLILRGGTHVAWSPTFDYVRDVYLPVISSMGVEADCRLNRWGFYPNGGGEVEVNLTPLAHPLQPCQRTRRGELQRVTGRAAASNLPSHIPQRMVNRAASLLEDRGLSCRIAAERVSGAGPGAGIFLAASYEQAQAGFAALGKPGKPSERVAEEACELLLAHHESGAPVDKRLADQLLLPSALAAGRSVYDTSEVTCHLLTNGHVIRQFIPAVINVGAEEGKSGTVSIDGIGHAS